jgi:hypothetical protein
VSNLEEGARGEAPDPGPRHGEILPPEGSIPSAELERVIRRAAELQSAAGEARTEVLDAGEILRIGREVGLDERHVRQALAEVQADALLPEPPRESALALRLWGEAHVRATRTVPGSPSVVQSRVESHFRDRESLAEVRRRPGRSLWRPSTGLASKVQRTFDLSGRSYDLAEVRQIELAVTGLEADWSLVTLTADLTNRRASFVGGWLTGSVCGYGLLAVATVLSFALPPALPIAVAGGAAVGTTVWGAGFNLRRQRASVALAMEGLLDRLEQGGPLEPRRPSLRDKFLGT